MTKTPGWAFHTQWGMAAGKTCTCGQQLCWQPRSHRRALLRRSLAENTHSRTHRNQTGISCLPRQVLIKTAKPFFSSSPLPFSAEVRRLREKRKTREEKKRVRRFLPHHPASFPGSYIICVLFQMKLTMHKYLPAKNNNKHTCCKHCLNVLCWGKKKEAANVAGCRYRRRICGIATFPGKLLRNFQTDGEESNLRRSPFLKAAQIICDCFGFHRPAADRGGGTFWSVNLVLSGSNLTAASSLPKWRQLWLTESRSAFDIPAPVVAFLPGPWGRGAVWYVKPWVPPWGFFYCGGFWWRTPF